MASTKIKKKEMLRLQALTAIERSCLEEGFTCIAGVDEAGRGPLAGPVVAAACIIPKDVLIPGIDDSKKLKPAQRQFLYDRLVTDPTIIYGVGIVESDEIDRINIYQATIQAMRQAIDALILKPDILLIDGLKLEAYPIPSRKIIKGDSLSQSIAAASIIAKETRDRLMNEQHRLWPSYKFDQHKGYATSEHLAAIKKYGPCPIHRKSYGPIKEEFQESELFFSF